MNPWKFSSFRCGDMRPPAIMKVLHKSAIRCAAGRDGVAGPRVNDLILVPEDRINRPPRFTLGGFCMTRQDEGGRENSNMLSRRTLVGAMAIGAGATIAG